MKRTAPLLSCFLFLFHFIAIAQPTSPGDVMFVGFNADGRDGFAFVTLVAIPNATQIHFNDNEWNELAIGSGGAFNGSGESEMTWENTTGGTIAAGRQIIISDGGAGSPTTDIGTVSGNNVNLASSNEVIYSFIGTSNTTPTSFLSAIANNGFSLANGSLVNTGLTAGSTAISISGNEDVMVYDAANGTSCNTTVADCAAMIATSAFWVTDDGTGDQSQNGLNAEFPNPAGGGTGLPGDFTGDALPIELVFFEAKRKNDFVQIAWQTASEINNDFFTLQHSTDALNFEDLAIIPGAGTTVEPKNYSFTDTTPFRGFNYYRLEQTDFDGTSTFSPIVSAFVLSKEDVRVNPTLATESLELQFKEFQEFNSKAVICTTYGQKIKTTIIPAGITEYSLEINDLPSGNYFLKLQSGKTLDIIRFIKM